MAERILIDTGPIVAILCRQDAAHEKSAESLRTLNAELCTCWPVISEAVFLLGRRTDRIQFLFQMLSSGAIRIESLGSETAVVNWFTDFYNRFGDVKPDLADAALMYLGDVHQFQKIFTLELRDFSVYRTRDNRALEVVGVAT